LNFILTKPCLKKDFWKLKLDLKGLSSFTTSPVSSLVQLGGSNIGHLLPSLIQATVIIYTSLCITYLLGPCLRSQNCNPEMLREP